MRIFLDIETSATSREDIREQVMADVRPPGNIKKTESIMAWEVEKGKTEREEAVAKTALNGLWGELLVIGFAVEDRDPVILPREMSESALLSLWYETIEDEIKSSRIGLTARWDVHAQWIGHNIEAFDLRFLWQRSCVLKNRVPFRLPLARYPKEPSRYDTMTEWAGYNGRVSQKNLEMAFGIERSDPLPMGGADVHKALQEERVADIITHCTEDVRCLREIFRRMTS